MGPLQFYGGPEHFIYMVVKRFLFQKRSYKNILTLVILMEFLARVESIFIAVVSCGGICITVNEIPHVKTDSL